jgi:hypothetical protein
MEIGVISRLCYFYSHFTVGKGVIQRRKWLVDLPKTNVDNFRHCLATKYF